MDIATLALAKKREFFQGEDGKQYKIVACVVENSGAGWQAIDNAQHGTLNVASIENNTSGVIVNYDFTAKKVISFVATPDETFTNKGYSFGASVGLSSALIKIARQQMLVNAYIAYNGTDWTVTGRGVTGVSFSSGILTIDHDPDVYTSFARNVSCRNGAYITSIGKTGVDSTEIYITDYSGDRPSVADTSMRIFFNASVGLPFVNPNDVVVANANIWCMGVFEI